MIDKFYDKTNFVASFHIGNGDAVKQFDLLVTLAKTMDVTTMRQKDLHHLSLPDVMLEILKLIEEKPTRHFASASNSATLYFPDFYISANENRDYIAAQLGDEANGGLKGFTICMAGNVDKVAKYEPIIHKHFTKKNFSRVEWWYNTREDGVISKIIPLTNVPVARPEFYPWFDGDITAHLDSFMKDKSGVLMLFGPPGTGKTSLLRHFIKTNDLVAIVAYEDVLLENDEMFISFLNRKENMVLLIEDADLLISSRGDGNKLITRFLNMADGILTHEGNKKIIFTSNINNYANIDEALTRPGRCYDIIEFKYLTSEQANNIATMVGKPAEFKHEASLAEVFNQGKKTDKVTSKLGFAA